MATATPDVTAGTIMDSAAALLNDTEKQIFTYAKQLPYLKIALKELREWLELNNSPITDYVSSVLTVPAGTYVISFTSSPALPTDLVEIQQLWERGSSSDPFIPMKRMEFLPHYMEGQEISQFKYWTWYNNQIQVLPATASVQLKLDYIRTLFTTIVDENSTIGMINCDSFLHYRTAGLVAEFVGENPTRAQTLNAQAYAALERVTGIDNKGRQQISTRHRPFRASFKSRGLW